MKDFSLGDHVIVTDIIEEDAFFRNKEVYIGRVGILLSYCENLNVPGTVVAVIFYKSLQSEGNNGVLQFYAVKIAKFKKEEFPTVDNEKILPYETRQRIITVLNLYSNNLYSLDEAVNILAKEAGYDVPE